MTARTGEPGDKSAGTGLQGQDSWYRPIEIGQQERTIGTGQPEQDIHKWLGWPKQ